MAPLFGRLGTLQRVSFSNRMVTYKWFLFPKRASINQESQYFDLSSLAAEIHEPLFMSADTSLADRFAFHLTYGRCASRSYSKLTVHEN
jgi:hypothetical protein